MKETTANGKKECAQSYTVLFATTNWWILGVRAYSEAIEARPALFRKNEGEWLNPKEHQQQ